MVMVSGQKGRATRFVNPVPIQGGAACCQSEGRPVPASGDASRTATIGVPPGASGDRPEASTASDPGWPVRGLPKGAPSSITLSRTRCRWPESIPAKLL